MLNSTLMVPYYTQIAYWITPYKNTARNPPQACATKMTHLSVYRFAPNPRYMAPYYTRVAYWITPCQNTARIPPQACATEMTHLTSLFDLTVTYVQNLEHFHNVFIPSSHVYVIWLLITKQLRLANSLVCCTTSRNILSRKQESLTWNILKLNLNHFQKG